MKRIKNSPTLQAALWYAQHGFPVFPCKPKAKNPLTRHGFQEATLNQGQIKKWWAQFPDANIAVPTGKSSGLIAIDIDLRQGGEKTWAALRDKRKIPRTAQQRTGNGRHLIFRDPSKIRSGILVPGVDIKGEGGYIIVAPSIHPNGARYRWSPGHELTKRSLPPTWLLQNFRDKHTKSEPNQTPNQQAFTQGERNTQLTSLAGTMRQRGMSQEAIEAALIEENRTRCKRPLPEDEVQRIARSISKYPPGSAHPHTSRKSQATQLIESVSDIELFHAKDKEAYAVIMVNDHREIWRLRDSDFKHWLAQRYYAEYGRTPSTQAMNDALSVLGGKAHYKGNCCDVFTRVARLGNAIYIDLGDDKWLAVKITRRGWKIVRNPKARFRRPHGLQALSRPERGGSIHKLWHFINVRKRDRIALLAWLLGAFQFGGPFFTLILQGEQGSAKSTTANVLRRLIDPNESPLRGEPRGRHDLMIAARNSWVTAFDNISSLPFWLSDALCSLATGGGFATRRLYTNDEESIFKATRPILLNGIEGIAIRGDLLDRSLVLDLPIIRQRRKEEDLWRGFEKIAPRIFGALLDGVVAALRGKRQLEIDDLPRMADAASWAATGLTAFGYQPERVIRVIKDVQAMANTVPLDATPVIPVVRGLLRREREYKGTAAELLQTLGSRMVEKRIPKGWPNSPQQLSATLRRLAPNLRAVGVDIEFRQQSGTGSRKIISIIDKQGYFSDASDASDASNDEED